MVNHGICLLPARSLKVCSIRDGAPEHSLVQAQKAHTKEIEVNLQENNLYKITSNTQNKTFPLTSKPSAQRDYSLVM